MNRVLRKIDQWFERTGRKLMRVNAFGEIIVYRYCLLRKEGPNEYERTGSWPNVYLHVWNLEESPDGGAYHSHPSNTLSIFLKGEYLEMIKGVQRVRKPLSFQYLTVNDKHRVVSCKAGSVTLFARGFAKQPVIMAQDPCRNTCDWCRDNEPNGQCFNTGKEFPLDSMFSLQFDRNRQQAGAKFGGWYVCTPENYATTEKRRVAMKKLKRELPKDPMEHQQVVRNISKLPEMYYQSVGNVEMAEKAKRSREQNSH